MQDSTKIVRSTLTRAVAGDPLHPSPVFAAPFHTPGDPNAAPYNYARNNHPTWTVLERAIGQMESGVFAPAHADAGKSYRANALVFASGMAACASVFGAVLRPGDVVVLPTHAYFAARALMQEYFAKMGVVVRQAPTAGDAQGELLEGARLLWIESPSNPLMEVCDIVALSERAHRAGALVAVDNTTATPLGQRTLSLGADFAVASDTKSMTGHSDIVLGHVATRDLELRQQIEQWRTLMGGILGPMEAWLALRSIATLPLRLETKLGQRPAHRRVPRHAHRCRPVRALPRPAHASRPRTSPRARCVTSAQSSASPSPAAPPQRPSSPKPSSSPRPPASAAPAPALSAARAGAETPSPRASSASAPASKMSKTCSKTSIRPSTRCADGLVWCANTAGP